MEQAVREGRRFLKLERIAREHWQNEPLETLIPRLVNEFGLHEAATMLTVFPNTLRNWADANGYELVVPRKAQMRKVANA